MKLLITVYPDEDGGVFIAGWPAGADPCGLGSVISPRDLWQLLLDKKAAPLTNGSALRLLAGALLKITPCASFPRKACPEPAEGRESTGVGPRFRGGDEGGDFHSLGRAGGPSKLRRH
jgi:hypothetical protein